MRKYVWHGILLGILRITFDNFPATLANMPNSGLQQLDRHTFASKCFGDEQARDGPDGLVVERLQDSRALQGRIHFSRSKRTPTNRLASGIGEQARRFTRSDNPSQCLPVFLTLLLFILGTLQSPQHAPAPAASAPLAKEFFQIRPTARGDWMNFHLQRGASFACCGIVHGAASQGYSCPFQPLLPRQTTTPARSRAGPLRWGAKT